MASQSSMTQLDRVAHMVKDLFQSIGKGSIHGCGHAMEFMMHAKDGLKSYPQLDIYKRQAVLLAALLHDVDDHKFFPGHTEYRNALSGWFW